MQQGPHAEHVSERLREQSGVIEVTKISSKDRTWQRTGGQILEGFNQERVQLRFVEQNIVREMLAQLVEVPKMMSQNGIHRRTAEADRRPSSSCPPRWSKLSRTRWMSPFHKLWRIVSK